MSRRFNILKQLSRNVENHKLIFGFDIETVQADHVSEGGLAYKENKFLMGSVVGDDMRRVFWDKQEMQEFMLYNRKLRDNVVMATNLTFDFNMLFDDYDDAQRFQFLPKGGKFIRVKYERGKHAWTFLDTLNYTMTSVQKLGQMLGLPKLEHPTFLGQAPSTWAEREELIAYNVQDSLISQKFGVFMQDFCNGIGAKMKNTIAATGLDYWRRQFQPKDLFQERRAWIDLHFEGSVKGGRTENFKRGYFEGVYYYDFNSMYPSVCRDGIDGKGAYPDPSSARRYQNLSWDYIENFEGISKVDVVAPDLYIPLLGMHDKNGKLFFPKGNITGWWTHVELRKAVKMGYVVEHIHDTIYYEASFVPFKDCVQTLYDLRMRYRAEGNAPMEQMIKVLMNAGLFGKFAQQIRDKSVPYHIDAFFVDADGQCYVRTKDKVVKLHNFVTRGNYVFETIDIPLHLPVYIMPILASYTTALSRIKLYEHMHAYEKHVIYCDTDSITVNKRVFSSGDKLGELKLEWDIDEAIFNRPKQYAFRSGEQEIVKVKGVKKKVLGDFDSFKKLLRTRHASYDRFTTIKESGVRKIPFGSIIDVDKTISLEDDKRIWKGKFSTDGWQDSKPLRMIEGMSEIDHRKNLAKAKHLST